MPPGRHISVIIPTITGREQWLARCLASYESRSPHGTEFIVIKDEPSCGHAWIKGWEQSTGHYVHFTADDIQPATSWWADATRLLDAKGLVPAAWVLNQEGKPNMCDSPLGSMGDWPNILVPMLTRPMLEEHSDWLPSFHYGSDDWMTYKAVQLGYEVRRLQSYKFVHHVAPQGRNYLRRPDDVDSLAAAMEESGYLPPVYRQLQYRLQFSDTGLDTMSMSWLAGRTVYAASQFKNEVDVFEIKLDTIGDMVDKFVLAEATVDQRGRPKDLVWPRWKDTARFRKWAKKIEYVVVDDMPTGSTHADDVKRERHQRDALIRGMPNLEPHDLVYVSDLDEIPTYDAFMDGLMDPPMRFGMDLHVYALNWRWLDRGCRVGTLGAVLLGKDILEQGVNHAVLHDSRVKQRPGISGWHLTYQGGVDAIHSKITGMMDKHQDLVMPGLEPDSILERDWIQGSISTGRDVFGREYRQTEWVDVSEMPPYVARNPKKFKHMMVPRPINQDEIESQPRCDCGGIFQNGVLAHFERCQLSQVADTIVVHQDDRARPRSLDV